MNKIMIELSLSRIKLWKAMTLGDALAENNNVNAEAWTWIEK